MLFFSWGSAFLGRTSPLFIAPHLVKGMGLSALDIGILSVVCSLTWAISSLVFGIVSDSIGRKTVLVPAMFASGFLLILSAFVQDFGQLLIVRALFGIVAGPCWTVICALINEESEPDVRGRNVGVVVSAAGLLSAGVGPIFVNIIAVHYGFRWSLGIVGTPTILMALLLWLFMHEPEERIENGPKPGIGAYFSVLRYRNVWLACLGASGLFCFIGAFFTYGTLFMTQVMRQTTSAASSIMAVFGFGTFVWSFVGPAISDKIGRKLTIILLSLLGLALPIALQISSLYQSMAVLMVIVALSSAVMASNPLMMVLVPSEAAPPVYAGTVIGLASISAELCGSVGTTYAIGQMTAAYGLSVSMKVGMAGLIIVVIASFCLSKETYEQANEAPSAEYVGENG